MIRIGIRLWNDEAETVEDAWAEIDRTDVDEVSVTLHGRRGEDLGTIYATRYEAGLLSAALEAEARPRAWRRPR